MKGLSLTRDGGFVRKQSHRGHPSTSSGQAENTEFFTGILEKSRGKTQKEIKMGSKKSSINKLSELKLFAFATCAILWIFIGLLSAMASEEQPSPVSAEELVSQIAMYEKKLLNLKVQSELRLERREPNSLKWQPTPVYTSCTAWFDGDPNGRARVDVHKEILEWEDGAAPYGEESYSTGFDGREGRTVHHRSGPVGQTREYCRGDIFPEAPKMLRTNWLAESTGTGFSTFFLFDQFACPRGKRLSELLAYAISQAGTFPITWETLGGTKCIRIGGGEPEVGHEFLWLDPARGFALLRYEVVNITRDGRKWIVDSDTVTKLTEAAPGVWYPTEAYHEWSSPGCERTDRRIRYRASEVVANDPNFDQSIFTVTFPAGCLIKDKINGVRYRAGSPLDKLRRTLDQLVDETLAVDSEE